MDVVRVITEEELMSLGSDARVEVVDGEIVEMTPVGGLHHIIAGIIHDLLKTYVKPRKLGFVFMDGLIYLMNKKSAGLRDSYVPDVSFIRQESIPKDWDVERPFPGAPTLPVEITSPGDDVEAVIRKVRKYLEAGTEQVWVVFPRQKEIHQYIKDNPNIRTYTGTDSIDAEALFPGVSLPLPEIFAQTKLE